MKKFVKFFVLAAALTGLLALAGCGGSDSGSGSGSNGYTTEQAQAVLDSGAFTDELEELDCDAAWSLYRLEDAGLSRDQLTDGLVRRSAGATCEELALLIFADQDSAETAQDALSAYLEEQIDTNRDYRPAEIPKLEDALLQQSGNTILMVVSNDTQLVKDALG